MKNAAMRVWEFVKDIARRILKEPALAVGLVIAAGNLIGQDFSEIGSLVETLIILLGAFLVRTAVAPVSTLEPMTSVEFVEQYGPGFEE